MPDKSGSKITHSNKAEKSEKQGQWSMLPSLPLENIYSYLRREDQFNMSLVCQKWSQEFYSPSVWRNFRFYMTESQLMTDNCPVMKSVRKNSSMIRHLEIDYYEITFNRRLIHTWCEYLIKFLKILTENSQLSSIELRDLFHVFGVLDTPKYRQVCRAIEEFLGSQRHLKRVEFHSCLFEVDDGSKILKKLTVKSAKSLTHLVLRGFVLWHPDREGGAYLSEQPPKIAQFHNLSMLETDYSPIFENMVLGNMGIQAATSCQKNGLVRLILYNCHDFYEIRHFRGLKPTDWRLMKELYPDLQVEFFDIEEYGTRRLLNFYIKPIIPISHLEYKNGDIEIAGFFYHLLNCKTNDHLVSLHLVWEEPIRDLSSTFIPFLQSCKKLKCLEVFLVFPTNGIDLLLKSWLDDPHESLEKVVINLWGIDNENDYQSLLMSTTGYAFILKLRGLDISVGLEKYI